MPELADRWISLFGLKPAIVAIALVLLWFLESAAPMFIGRARRASHDLSNLALGLINAAATSLLFGGAMLIVTEWARRQPFGLMHWIEPPAWIAWPVALVLFDFWMYLWHVLNHKVPFLWRFHAVHHADRELDASTALRFHTGEIVLSSMARLVVIPLIGMSLPQLLLYETLLAPIILFHHSNIRIPYRIDAALRWAIPTPWMHWVHHSRLRTETDSNYSSVLSIWDRLFGTFRLRDDPTQLDLGLDEVSEERQWRTIGGMLGRPFQRS